MHRRAGILFVFVLLLAIVCSSTNSYSGKNNKSPDATSKEKNAGGKPCKGFDPKIDEVVERDKNGNCKLYHRYKESPGVSFVYDKNGELWTRVYGSDFQ